MAIFRTKEKVNDENDAKWSERLKRRRTSFFTSPDLRAATRTSSNESVAVLKGPFI